MRGMLLCAPMMRDPITLTEAGKILGRDPSSLRHRILKGTLRAEKHGRDYWVSRKMIESLAKNGNGHKNKK